MKRILTRGIRAPLCTTSVINKHRHRERQTDTERDRQTQRETDRQTQRETDREWYLSLGVNPDNTLCLCVNSDAVWPSNVLTDKHTTIDTVHVSTFQPRCVTPVSPQQQPMSASHTITGLQGCSRRTARTPVAGLRGRSQRKLRGRSQRTARTQSADCEDAVSGLRGRSQRKLRGRSQRTARTQSADCEDAVSGLRRRSQRTAKTQSADCEDAVSGLRRLS